MPWLECSKRRSRHLLIGLAGSTRFSVLLDLGGFLFHSPKLVGEPVAVNRGAGAGCSTVDPVFASPAAPGAACFFKDVGGALRSDGMRRRQKSGPKAPPTF